MANETKSIDYEVERLEEIGAIISEDKGRRDLLLRKLDETKKKKRKAEKDVINTKKASAIIQKVAQETQEEIEYYVSEIPTLALASVFSDPYELDVSFVQRRERTETDISFVRGDMQIHPYDGSGFGPIDVGSLGLRLAMMNLRKPPLRRVLVLDEPFKHLKGIEENKNVIQMIKQLSTELGLQIIMVHDERVPIEEIRKGADKIFKVSMKKRVSKVEEI